MPMAGLDPNPLSWMVGTYHPASFYWLNGALQAFCPVWPVTTILLIFASQVARITGVSTMTHTWELDSFNEIGQVKSSLKWRESISDPFPTSLLGNGENGFKVHSLQPVRSTALRRSSSHWLLKCLTSPPVGHLGVEKWPRQTKQLPSRHSSQTTRALGI
jgi:hypothetical protein